MQNDTTTQQPVDTDDDRRDIHDMFSLTYSNYLVVERTLAQSMPDEWQRKFVALIDELNAAFAHVDRAEAFEVTPGVQRTFDELTNADMATLKISVVHDHDGPVYLRGGQEYGPDDRLVVPRPDPVPHYNRGRTFVQPATTGT